MRLTDAQQLAESLMVDHGLKLGDPWSGDRSWRFRFDNAKRRAGQCNYTTRTISLSRHVVELWDERNVRNTILHEIAHALAGNAAGHGPEWKRIARRVGAKPQRCTDADLPVPPAPYLATCSSCGQEYPRHRRPKGTAYCSRHPRRDPLVWVDTRS